MKVPWRKRKQDKGEGGPRMGWGWWENISGQRPSRTKGACHVGIQEKSTTGGGKQKGKDLKT